MRNNVFLLLRLVVVVTCNLFWSCTPGRYASGNKVAANIPANQHYFLFLSDVHLDGDTPETGPTDDAGKLLWGAVMKKIDTFFNNNRKNPPAFILYTGDLPRHGTAGHPDKWNPDVDSVLRYLKHLSSLKGTPILYMPGNNDSRDGNYCLFDGFGDAAPWYASYPYDAFHVAKDSGSSGAYMVSGDSVKSGYYVAKIKGFPLRIISLNSVVWSATSSYCTAADSARPAQGNAQMDWLAQQLRYAAAAGDKVYLAMHIPPGIDAYGTACPNGGNCVPVCDSLQVRANMWRTAEGTSDWQYRFLKMMAHYKGTVAGIFFGHTHMDEFRLLHDPASDTITQVAISCPGISVRNGNNPGFKLVYFDENSFAPTDFTTFYVSNFQSPITWSANPYRFSDSLGKGNSLSILDNLKGMDRTKREKILHSIYTVQRDIDAIPCYYNLGLDVRSIQPAYHK